jgi:hypothetical protein
MLDMSIKFFPSAEIEIAHAEVSPLRKIQSALKCRKEGLVDIIKDLRHSNLPKSAAYFAYLWGPSIIK